MEQIKLDAIDRRLLYELDTNSRQSLSQLARTLREGRDRIGYRLERLLNEGVVKQCTVTINPYRLGYTLFKTYLKVSKRKERYTSLLALLRNHPRIYWIADCDGRWDLIFCTFAKTPYEFFEIQNRILGASSDIVLSFTNFTLVNVWMYRKNYLIPRSEDCFLIGGPPSQYSLERNEWEILRLLSQNSRMSFAQLARETRSNESTVRYRLEQLERSGVVAGYRVELDLSRLGMMFFKAQIYLAEYGSEDIEALRRYCAGASEYHILHRTDWRRPGRAGTRGRGLRAVHENHQRDASCLFEDHQKRRNSDDLPLSFQMGAVRRIGAQERLRATAQSQKVVSSRSGAAPVPECQASMTWVPVSSRLFRFITVVSFKLHFALRALRPGLLGRHLWMHGASVYRPCIVLTVRTCPAVFRSQSRSAKRNKQA